MSALLPILDISRVHCDVRYVPKADVHQSVENLVSAGNHGRRNSNAECLAAFKLIVSSNLVGAWTGSSVGFSPLRMRSTYDAARRKLSVRSSP